MLLYVLLCFLLSLLISSFLFFSFHSLRHDQFAAVISLSLEIVPWLSVIWLLWLYSLRTISFTFCPSSLWGVQSIAFCLCISIVLNVDSHQATRIKMLFNDIKRNWLKSNCESRCAAYAWWFCDVPFNWNISTKTGFQSIQTIEEIKFKNWKIHHILSL